MAVATITAICRQLYQVAITAASSLSFYKFLDLDRQNLDLIIQNLCLTTTIGKLFLKWQNTIRVKEINFHLVPG